MTRVHWGDTAEGSFVLPAGTVTLLLSDVEGSVRSWEADATAMTATVAMLDELITEVVAECNGVRPIEQGEGDSFVAAFPKASDAVAAALAIQLGTLDDRWPSATQPRLRMALHSGEVQLRDEGNYIGGAINRCARIRALGHGQQILLSAATRDLVLDHVPSGVELIDLGSHRLRDLYRPEHIHQLAHPRLPRELPPLRSLDSVPNNLPIQLTSFIGRATEIDDVVAALRQHRAVTLTGSGGSGKTRLALHVAASIIDDYPDGVWFVDLSAVSEPELVAHSIASTLRLSLPGNGGVQDAIASHLASAQALLILDNCEHLVAPCAAIVDAVLHACSTVTVLSTSRENLSVPGEVTWPVPSLRLPAATETARIEHLATFDAVRLFVDRATSARPNFAVTNANAPAVAAICARLDGIPLALELAAARTRLLSAEQIAEGLEQHYRVLGIGPRTSAPRQQTLEASIDWSHSLLDADERIAFRRLSVFRDGFTLDAAEHICGAGDLESMGVLDLLGQLVDKSLVIADDLEAGVRRYRLLDTVRQFAADQLDISGEHATIRSRHVDYFASFIEKTDLALAVAGPDSIAVGARIRRETANTRAATQTAAHDGDGERLMALVSWAPTLAGASGASVELRPWIEEALRIADPLSARRPKTVHAAAVAAMATGDYITAVQRLHEALALFTDQKDSARRAEILFTLGQMTAFATGLDPARPMLDEAIELAVVAGTFPVELLGIYSFVLTIFGHLTEARAAQERAEALRAQGFGLPWRVPDAHRAFTLALQGHARSALDIGAPAVAELQAYGIDTALVTGLFALAEAAASTGDIEAAKTHAAECLAVARRVNGPGELGQAATIHARVLVADDDAVAARELLADALRTSPLMGDLVAHQHLALAEAELADGDIEAACASLAQADAFGSNGRLNWVLAFTRCLDAHIEIGRGQLDRAEDRAHQALVLAQEEGAVGLAIDCLELLGCIAAMLESHTEAFRLWGACEAERQRLGYTMRRRHVRDVLAASTTTARQALGEEGSDEARDAGNAMSLNVAVGYAQRGRGERKRPSHGWASLTAAELRVAELVAQGRTNPQIGEQLFVSRETVKGHVASIFTKLGLSSRTELAA
ncbi:MAG: hypothetical protein QOD38_254, partial [Acidimicrobiaceae bacterium]